jgi:hypothetical protein
MLETHLKGNELKHLSVARESYELGTSEIETAISINLTSRIRRKQVETPRRYPLNFLVGDVQNNKIRLKILGVTL